MYQAVRNWFFDPRQTCVLPNMARSLSTTAGQQNHSLQLSDWVSAATTNAGRGGCWVVVTNAGGSPPQFAGIADTLLCLSTHGFHPAYRSEGRQFEFLPPRGGHGCTTLWDLGSGRDRELHDAHVVPPTKLIARSHSRAFLAVLPASWRCCPCRRRQHLEQHEIQFVLLNEMGRVAISH
jgi:hypothetical protein